MRKASSDGVRTRQIEAMGEQFAQKREKEADAGQGPAKERVRLIFQSNGRIGGYKSRRVTV